MTIRFNGFWFIALVFLLVCDTAWCDQYAFTGQIRDDSGGLYHLRQRDYDAETGGFLSADPIGVAGGLNGYGYCGGNPVNSIDPNGTAAADAVYGYSDGFTGDITKYVRNTYAPDAADTDSIEYKGAYGTGVAASMYVGVGEVVNGVRGVRGLMLAKQAISTGKGVIILGETTARVERTANFLGVAEKSAGAVFNWSENAAALAKAGDTSLAAC